MGSDLYDVRVRSYREHTKAEAITRSLAFGRPIESAEKFFQEDGPWVETRLHVTSTHPDAPVLWDHVFVLRLLDEAVLCGGPGPGGASYGYQHTPIADEIAGLWSMSPKVDADAELPILIVEVTAKTQGTARNRNPVGETAEIVSFVPKRLAPNIASVGSFESRAWSGPTWRRCEPYPADRGPRLAQVFGLRRESLAHTKNLPDSATRIAPRPGGGIYVLGRSELAAITPDGNVTTLLDVGKASGGALGQALAVDAAGDVWIGTRRGLLVLRAGAGQAERIGLAEGIKSVADVAALPDGRLLVGAKEGLFVRGTDGGWTHFEDGLVDRNVHRVWGTKDGFLWAYGYKGLSRIGPDGKIEKMGKRQGIEVVSGAIALPSGESWLFHYANPTTRIEPGAPGAVACPLAARVAPEGIANGFVAKNGILFFSTQRTHVVRLEEGAAPACFVFENDSGDRAVDASAWPEICLSEEGDLYVLGNGGLCVSRAIDIEASRQKGPLNADSPSFDEIGPVTWSGGEAAGKAASAVDFQGKSVVLTGTLATMTRTEAQRLLTSRGAVLSDSIGKTTDYLIAGLKAGSKLQKAEKLGVKVLGEEALRALLQAPEPAPAKPADVKPADVKPAAGKTKKKSKVVFPLSDEPGAPMSSLASDTMRSLAESGAAMTKKGWKTLLDRHRAFLDAGGAGGMFHSLEVSGLVMAVYAGGSGGASDDQANLQRKKLPSGFDAKNANLPFASGCGMIAENVDFSGANLGHGNYTDAFLRGSRFDGASLVSSDFSRSDLAGASFRGADLTGADFENADLTDADFEGAKLEGSRFPGAKLEGAKR